MKKRIELDFQPHRSIWQHVMPVNVFMILNNLNSIVDLKCYLRVEFEIRRDEAYWFDTLIDNSAADVVGLKVTNVD